MGLLDELEHEIQKRQLSADHLEQQKLDREEIFRTQLAPRMDTFYEYLKKLVFNLKVLKPEKMACFSLNGYGEIIGYILHEYDLQITTQFSSKEIRLSFPCVIATEQCPLVKVEGASKVKAINGMFQRHHIGGLSASQKDSTGKWQHATFQAKGRILLSAVFTADVASSAVKLNFNNFDQFTTITKTIYPEQFTDDLFDQIGRYITRDSNNLFRESIPDSYRRKLQTRIHQEAITRKWGSKLTSHQEEDFHAQEREDENNKSALLDNSEKESHSWFDNVIKKWRDITK